MQYDEGSGLNRAPCLEESCSSATSSKQHSSKLGLGAFTEENMRAVNNRDADEKEGIWGTIPHVQGMWTSGHRGDRSQAAQRLGLHSPELQSQFSTSSGLIADRNDQERRALSNPVPAKSEHTLLPWGNHLWKHTEAKSLSCSFPSTQKDCPC